MNDPEEVTMGTDPTTPGDEQPAPGTDAALGPETGTPAYTPPPEAPPAAPESDTSGEDEEIIETEVVVEEEVIRRQTDGTAPGGHVQTTEEGYPRQAGDPNPELGVTPDTLPEPGETPVPPPDTSEPEQVEIDRPDIGTPVNDEKPADDADAPEAEEE